MYKHILIPSDGSELAEKAVQIGIEFASLMRARVTAFTAVPEYQVPSHGEIVSRTDFAERIRLERGGRTARLGARRDPAALRRAGSRRGR